MNRRHFVLAAIIIAIAILTLFSMGRTFFGPTGELGFWSGDIKSQFNSQRLFDPYTFTHIAHGIGFYLLLWFLFPRMSLGWRLVFATALEAGWEIFENTEFIIERYRAVTLARGYYGDSILNVAGDILVTIAGFLLAARLSMFRAIIAAFILIEIILAFLIRDNLTLNILMLIYPIPAIRTWQLGG
ncbi:MAG: DUF2585 family protein [bacterium]|nr:DUF2585 family protein [bacterium]